MHYRLHFYSEMGRIEGVRELDCADDATARSIAEAEAGKSGRAVVAWDHARMVAHCHPHGATPIHTAAE
jgi:hypothetical protein